VLFLLPFIVDWATLSTDAPAPVASPAFMGCPAPVDRDPRVALWLIDRPTPPTTSSAPPRLERERAAPLEIWRDDDGLFYVDGRVNGQTVRFLVDTGASMIVLTAADAARVGAGANATVLQADTASGKAAMAGVTLAAMQVGPIGAAEVPAAVAREGLQVSLLGQNWLSHLNSVTIEGDRMLLH
jgi:aspartyl protease family protein